MFRPEPMRHLSLVVLASDLEAATRAIAREGVLHLLDVRHLTGMAAAVQPYDPAAQVARLDGLRRTLNETATVLGLDEPSAPADPPDAGLDIEAVATRVAAIASAVEELRTQRRVSEQEEVRLQHLLRTLRAVAPAGLPLEAFRDLRYARLACGFLPEHHLAQVREALAGLPHLLTTAGGASADGRVFVAALCLRSDEGVLDRALRSAQFQPVELPAGMSGTPHEGIAALELERQAQQQTAAALDAERRSTAAAYGPEVARLRTWIDRERLLIEARGRMGLSERTALIVGWVPLMLCARLERALHAAVGDRCVLHWSEPDAVAEVRGGRIPVPILLNNPVLVRPFERLVRSYGMPRYGEVEPTAVVALGFLTMFGFMFGDLGQGLVLFLLGYFIYRRMFRYRDYAIILMECGVFAAAFGLLYGSVFGIETWLPALWLRPLEDVTRLMQAGVVFGIGFLSLGLVLNLVNAARRRDATVLWQPRGLLFALAYWIAVGLAIRRFTGGPGALGVGTAVVWLAVPIGVLLLRTPAVLVWEAVRARQRPAWGAVLAALVESLVEVLESAISAVSNTATFIRLAAFALSHAGLFLATFSVADVVSQTAGGTIGAALVIVLGNLVIIALEGLIVSVQSIRLEYYEFFSKFYSGSGEEYRPLHLNTAHPARP